MKAALSVVLVFLLACSGGSHAGSGAKHAADAGLDAAVSSNRGDAASADAALATTGDAATASTSDASHAADTGAAQAGPTRHYRLAATGSQLLVTGPALGFQLTPANLADDTDVMSIHQEFYGMPWDELQAKSTLPTEWVSTMEALAKSARDAHKPVFLSITMLNGHRESLAPKTSIENGQVKTKDDWSAKCYDFASASDAAQKRAAYLRYVDYMVKLFSPAYLNVAIEVNLFFEKCPAATPGLIDVINAAYATAKAASKSTLVFPSIQVDHLYGYSKDSCADQTKRDSCFDALYAALKPIKRDRFAMSSYPYMAGFKSVSELPADWFSRGSARGGEIPLIAETGWPSTPIVVRAKDGSCPKYFDFDEATSAAYLDRVLGDAKTRGLELVTWWSDRDLLVDQLMTDCPCSFDATWCSVLDLFRGPAAAGTADPQLLGELLLKVFGTMGIRHYDGSPKPMHYKSWVAARTPAYVP